MNINIFMVYINKRDVENYAKKELAKVHVEILSVIKY